MTKKDKIRKAIVELITGRRPSLYPPNQINHLKYGVAEALYGDANTWDDADRQLLDEVVVDLVVEKVLTIDLFQTQSSNLFVRLHSESSIAD